MTGPESDDERGGRRPVHAFLAAVGHFVRGCLRVLGAAAVPADAGELRVRSLAVVLTMVVAAAVGHWVCRPDAASPAGWTEPEIWWACGMLGITSAAAIAGWVGGRVPFLIPVLLPPLTLALTFGYMDLAAGMGHQLDALHGISAAGLSVFAGFAGMVAMIPVIALRVHLRAQRARRCLERESYAEGDNRAQ